MVVHDILRLYIPEGSLARIDQDEFPWLRQGEGIDKAFHRRHGYPAR